MAYDPFAAAMNPPERKHTTRWFGQMFAEVWACALVKGQGKVPFDPAMHDESKATTAVGLELVPLSAYSVDFTLNRDHVIFDKGWGTVTLPSIKALNVDLRNLHGSWCAIEFKETGETYIKGSTGETVKKTAFVLVGTYPNEAACRAAYQEFNQLEAGAKADYAEPWNPTVDTDKERETAAMFIGPLWKQAAGDVTKLQELLAGNGLTSKFFTLNSPEVTAVVGAGAN